MLWGGRDEDKVKCMPSFGSKEREKKKEKKGEVSEAESSRRLGKLCKIS